MRRNIIQEKAYSFAILIVREYKKLANVEKVLSKQLLRSGTSIGACVEEAVGAQSKKDFVSKIFISYKEARETRYWIRLLRDTKYLESKKSQVLLMHVEEICRILGKIINTSKKTQNN